MRSIFIAGNGTTSRNNVEALIEDYLHVPDKDAQVVLVFDRKPSEGQVFAAQYATDSGFTIKTFSNKAADFRGIVGDKTFSETPFETAFADKDLCKEAKLFMLWDDEDEECLTALSLAKAAGILAFDLCHGLIAINPNEDLEFTPPPVMPKQEVEVTPKPDADDEEDEDDDPTEADIIYEGIQAIADIFADAIVSRMQEMFNGKRWK